jgi:hypothetical protein
MSSATFTLEVIESRSSLSDCMITQWRDLENSAFESNIYLSPDFILPALEFLSATTHPIFIFIYQHTETHSKMVFAGVFEETAARIKQPFKTLTSYTTPHSFLAGILLDEKIPDQALDTFFQYWGKQKRWQALDLWLHWSNTPQGCKIREAAKRNKLEWIPIRSQERAAIIAEAGTAPVTKISKNLSKNITKKTRQLESLGELEYRYIDKAASMPAAIQSFLELEHQGWKGRHGSSLLSHPEQTAFFSSMTLALAEQNKVIFTEMRLSGKVIASTVNYLSGKAFFAFKTARDETLDQYSPGVLNEVALVKIIPDVLPKCEIFDSGAETGSYMDNIWKDKLLLASGYFTNNFWFRIFFRARNFVRRFK